MSTKNIEKMYPLSPVQQGMLYETIRNPDSGLHIEQLICSLRGHVQRTYLEQAWQWVVARHDILRTGFIWGEQTEPLQVVFGHAPVTLDYQDWQLYPPAEHTQRLEDYLTTDRIHGFKLTRAPLMRLALFQTAAEEYQFVWTHHHILMDGWCCHQVMHEVLSCYQALYQGRTLQLASNRPYRDYIAWLKKQDVSQAERFWRRVLHGLTQPTALGKVCEAALPEQTEHSHATVQSACSPDLSSRLQALARQHGLTLNTLLQGAWALLLSRYSGDDDILFGITVSGRPAELAGIESMVGLCINTLPVRLALRADEDLWSWLATIQAYNLELRQYEYSPAGLVHQWSDIPGSQLLYESLLVVENYPTDHSLLYSSALDFSIAQIQARGAQTKYALTLLALQEQTLILQCVYDTRRFVERDVVRILKHLQHILEVMAQDSPSVIVATLRALVSADEIPVVAPLARTLSVDDTQPRSPIEEVLVSIWMNVLGVERIGIHDNFFQLGGHSLLATQVASQIRATLRMDVPLRYLFAFQTIASLAEHITELKLGRQHPPLVALSRDTVLPLSFAQQRLWFLYQVAPDNPSYNIPRALRLQGEINVLLLQRCLEEIVRRHEALRTAFVESEGLPRQVIQPPYSVHIPVIDLQMYPAKQRDEYVQHMIQQEALRCFDLTQGFLLRGILLRLQVHEHILLVTFHHIAFDAWSEGVFVREFVALYQAFLQQEDSPLLPLPVQYADFAAWQQQWLQGEMLENLTAYWRRQLAGAKAPSLPTDDFQAVVPADGAMTTFLLPASLHRSLQTLSRQEDTTLFMTLFTAFVVLLYRYSGQEDIVVGTDIANRLLVETEPLIGFFVNVLLLRADLHGAPPFRKLLARVREMILDAYAHQDLPFEQIIDALQLERSASQVPLARVLFVFQNTPLPTWQLPFLVMHPVEIEMTTTNFDLAVFVREEEQGLRCSVNYNTHLFRATTIARLQEHFAILLQNIVSQPDTNIHALDMFSAAEKQRRSLDEASELATRRRKLRGARREDILLP